MNKLGLITFAFLAIAGTIYLLEYKHGGLKQLNQSSPTFEQYKQCHRDSMCSQYLCKKDDTKCNSALWQYNYCLSTAKSCITWMQEYQNIEQKMLDNDAWTTTNFESCRRECQPNNQDVSNLWNLYSCDMNCAGITV